MVTSYLTFNPAIKEAVNLDECINESLVKNSPLPLQYTWHVWEQVLHDDRNKDYSDNTRNLAEFDTVQKFWQLWSFMPQPSELLNNKRMVSEDQNGENHVVDALMIFKSGIKPMWEDPRNADGGHIEYRLRPQSFQGGQIDEYWNNLVLGVVGGGINGIEYITGIRLVDKLNQGRNACIRIEVWFTNCETLEETSAKVVEKLWDNVNLCMATKIDGSLGTIPKGDIKYHKSSK